MILLLDIGNTRIKWATLSDAGVGPQHAQPYRGWDREDLIGNVLHTVAQPERVIVANVGGAIIGQLVSKSTQDVWNVTPEFIVSTAQDGGVTSAYPDPQKLGVDRWVAVIAAHALRSGSACVVSVGTAMTIDGVDAAGRHLGGLIVPGPDLMVTSLLHSTSDIAARAREGTTSDSLFADNTLGAIHQGAVHALAALVERTHRAMSERLGETPALLLTGGAVARLQPLVSLPCKVMPDLVLQGLAVLARAPHR
jgi:type III pantothenate kinase